MGNPVLKSAGWLGVGLLAIALAGLPFVFQSRMSRMAAPAKFSETERGRAVLRGLHFIIGMARDAKVFEDYGADLLWCLYSIARTSADPEVSRIASAAARERALEFRRLYPKVRDDWGADDIAWMAHGSYSADMIGVRDDSVKEQIRRAAAKYTAEDFLWYDPAREPPPSDVPAACRCGRLNWRGVKVCTRCGAKLEMQSRYDVWLDSLVTTWMGERYGVRFGARYNDVVAWAPRLRPYPPHKDNPEFYPAVYAVTHVIYTLNDYSMYRLAPRCLADEFEFLKATARAAIVDHDPETLGEFLDSLRAFSLPESDPMIQEGFRYLLHTQNADGSWGDLAESPYGRYHSTWTAVDGLRDYRWSQTLCPTVGQASGPAAGLQPAR